MPKYITDEFDSPLNDEQMQCFTDSVDQVKSSTRNMEEKISLVNDLINVCVLSLLMNECKKLFIVKDVLMTTFQDIALNQMSDSQQRLFIDSTRTIQENIQAILGSLSKLQLEYRSAEQFIHPNQRNLVHAVRQIIDLRVQKKVCVILLTISFYIQ